MRWLLEGEWSGYTSAQQRVVHRVIVRQRATAAALMKLHSILYTDGTSLYLRIRELAPREKVGREIHGYDELIRKAIASGKSTYAVMPETEAP